MTDKARLIQSVVKSLRSAKSLAGMQYLCIAYSESHDRATDRRATAEWVLTELAKVELSFPLF